MNPLKGYPLWIVAMVMLGIGSLVGGALVGGSAMLASHRPEDAVAAAVPEVRETATMPATFAPVVKGILPVVVNISSTRVVRTSDQQDNPFGNIFPGLRM